MSRREDALAAIDAFKKSPHVRRGLPSKFKDGYNFMTSELLAVLTLTNGKQVELSYGKFMNTEMIGFTCSDGAYSKYLFRISELQAHFKDTYESN